MALTKQAKILSAKQQKALVQYVGTLRNGTRNRTIVLLSNKAGLRAKEISSLTWEMLVTPEGSVGDAMHLPDIASKGKSGRVIPLNERLRSSLTELKQLQSEAGTYSPTSRVVQTERSSTTSAQCVVNMFQGWYRDLGFVGCSSHSGRRTFITNAAKKISTVGGSLRDVQALAGHSSLQTTQRYIDGDVEAQRKIVDLV